MALRILRSTLAVTAFVAALVLATPTPAGAHGAVDITVHSDGTGSLWATVRWADGHLVSERLTALMTATGPAGRIGPAPMRGVAGQPGLVSYGDQLAAGTWQVAVEVAMPAIGRCDATVKVAAGTAPAEVNCPATVTPAATAPATSDRGTTAPPAAAPGPPDTGGPLLQIVSIVALATALVVGIVWWRRRR